MKKITKQELAEALGCAIGKKTMLAWYWKVCGEAYDETLNG